MERVNKNQRIRISSITSSAMFKSILRAFILGVIFNFTQLARAGYNGDSLGFGYYYSTYLGELEQGRYGLLLFSGRIVNQSIEFMGAIALYAVASWLILKIAKVDENSVLSILIQAIFMSQPHLATYSTFSYASFPYTLSYLLMITAVYVAEQKTESENRKAIIKRIIISSVCVAASFSIWQGYIPTFSSLALITILFIDDNKERIRAASQLVITAVLGTLLYCSGLKIVNSIYKITSTDARGFSGVLHFDIPVLKNPIETLIDCYRIFLQYLVSNYIVYNGRLMAIIHGLIGLLTIYASVLFVKKQSKKVCIVTVILLILSPLLFTFYRFITTDVASIPWTYLHSMVFVWVLILALLDKIDVRKPVRVIVVVLFLCVCVRQVYICNTNYSSIKARNEKSEAMAISMYIRLTQAEEWSMDIPVLVYGSMEPLYPDKNWYYSMTLKGWQPQVNQFVPYPGMPQNWVVQMNRIFSTQIEAVDYRWEKYADTINSKEFIEMECWPSKNCMKMINGTMVIKLGD